MRHAIRLLLWLCLLVLAPLPALAGPRIALVVGNGAYRNVAQLANPANDAKLMASILQALGFTLIGGAPQLDLDKAGFDTAVQTFGQQIQGAEVALLYYAGHGLQLRGTNYLVPVSANPTREADVDFQMVDVELVLRQMEGSGTRLNIVILDACRNNPFGGRGLRATGGGLAQMQAPEGTLISYATQPGNVAQDGEGDSPYTKALAETLNKPGLGIFDAFNAVGLAVKQATGGAQQPWVSSSPIAGSFYFAAPPAAPSSANGAPVANEAAIAWGVIQSTTSVAVLEDFIRQFSSSVYASMASARLDELKRSQIAVVAPPVQPTTPTSPIQQATVAPPMKPAAPTAIAKPGALIREFKGHSSNVYSVAFSPDGHRVLSGSYDHSLRLWDAASGALIREFKGDSDAVTSVAFSPDGQRVLSGSYDNSVRLWDAASTDRMTGDAVATPR